MNKLLYIQGPYGPSVDVTVNVINDVQRINYLRLVATSPIFYSRAMDYNRKMKVKENEKFEIRAIGEKTRYKWNEEKHKYEKIHAPNIIT